MRKIQPLPCLAVASVVLAVGLAACAYSEYDDPVRPPAESLVDIEQILDEMLNEELGYHSPIRVRSAREETCLNGLYNDDERRGTEVRTFQEGDPRTAHPPSRP